MTVLDILKKTNKPIDVPTLVKILKVNKTTVYRQLEKLLKDQKVLEVEFGDGRKRYEPRSLKHHHHLLCNNCGKLEDIELSETVLLNEVAKKSEFSVQSHSLEFFGLCVNCK